MADPRHVTRYRRERTASCFWPFSSRDPSDHADDHSPRCARSPRSRRATIGTSQRNERAASRVGLAASHLRECRSATTTLAFSQATRRVAREPKQEFRAAKLPSCDGRSKSGHLQPSFTGVSTSSDRQESREARHPSCAACLGEQAAAGSPHGQTRAASGTRPDATWEQRWRATQIL